MCDLCDVGVAGVTRPRRLHPDHLQLEGGTGDEDRQVPQWVLLVARHPHVHCASGGGEVCRFCEQGQEPEKTDRTNPGTYKLKPIGSFSSAPPPQPHVNINFMV